MGKGIRVGYYRRYAEEGRFMAWRVLYHGGLEGHGWRKGIPVGYFCT